MLALTGLISHLLLRTIFRHALEDRRLQTCSPPRVLDEEQVAAITDAVLAVERHYGYPVDVEWVLDRHRRAGEPVCVVQAPVTVTAPTEWNSVASGMSAGHSLSGAEWPCSAWREGRRRYDR